MMFGRRHRMPDRLRAALDSGERILAAVPTEGGELLVASRFGLWLVGDHDVVRWEWHLLSKVRLAGGSLHLTVAEELDPWPGGTMVLRDLPERTFLPVRSAKLTDVVHERVRRSVAASYHLQWPGSGGWVVLRRIVGRDGLTTQLRLDPGADQGAAGFADAVVSVRDQLWPAEVPRTGGAAEPE